VLSEYYSVSKAIVWNWVVKLREKLNIASERKAGRTVLGLFSGMLEPTLQNIRTLLQPH
jgi:hypothetical protein